MATQLHQSTGHSTATQAVHSVPKSLQMVWPELVLPPSPTLPPSPALPATLEPPLLLVVAEIELAPPAAAPPELEALSEPLGCRSTVLEQPKANDSRSQAQVDFTCGLSAFPRGHTRRGGSALLVRRREGALPARRIEGAQREQLLGGRK